MLNASRAEQTIKLICVSVMKFACMEASAMCSATHAHVDDARSAANSPDLTAYTADGAESTTPALLRWRCNVTGTPMQHNRC